MKKYKVIGYSTEIIEVEAERETETSIWIKGHRRKKHKDFEDYFDTWEEANYFLMERCENKVIASRAILKEAIEELAKAWQVRQ